jgi:hypothetical protein
MTYPQRSTFWHDEALITSGSDLNRPGHDTNQNYAFKLRQTTAANGDSFTQSFLIAEGTYTLNVFGYTSTNFGKLDWYIDNVLVVSGEDWYGSDTYNVLKTHAGISIDGNGRHVLKGVINGKSGSSSGYFYMLTKYWLYPTIDTTDV